MGYGDHYWGLYRDYYRNPISPFPTKNQTVAELRVLGTVLTAASSMHELSRASKICCEVYYKSLTDYYDYGLGLLAIIIIMPITHTKTLVLNIKAPIVGVGFWARDRIWDLGFGVTVVVVVVVVVVVIVGGGGVGVGVGLQLSRFEELQGLIVWVSLGQR